MHIQKIEQLTHEKWLNLFAADFEHDGHAGRWLFASRRPRLDADGAGDAVVIVPLLRQENQPPRLVMVREFRVPIGDYVIAFPAGLCDPGESVEDTARRELLEETGLEIAAIKRVTQPLYSSSGLSDEAVAMLFVEARAMPGVKPKLEASEDLQVLLLDFAEVCRLCDDRSVRIDAKAWATLHLYQQLGRLI